MRVKTHQERNLVGEANPESKIQKQNVGFGEFKWINSRVESKSELSDSFEWIVVEKDWGHKVASFWLWRMRWLNESGVSDWRIECNFVKSERDREREREIRN